MVLTQPAVQQGVVRGVTGGVGARTLAAALGMPTRAPYPPVPTQVLVARGTAHSLARAERDLHSVPQRPVLAVVADRDGVPRVAKAKITILRPHLAGVVQVPWVPRWREVLDPYSEARAVAAARRQRSAKYLLAYCEAVEQLQHALTEARRVTAQATTHVGSGRTPRPTYWSFDVAGEKG